MTMVKTTVKYKSEWLLFNGKWAICQTYHDKNKFHATRLWWWCPLCTRFRTNQSLLLLLTYKMYGLWFGQTEAETHGLSH